MFSPWERVNQSIIDKAGKLVTPEVKFGEPTVKTILIARFQVQCATERMTYSLII